MGLPLSNSEINQFFLEKNLIDYFTLQQYLSELVKAELLEEIEDIDNNTRRYIVTEEGSTTLEYFIQNISIDIKDLVSNYILENENRIKAEYLVNANYFLEDNNEYLVKCSVYNLDNSILMELSFSVPTREQAKFACSNWRKDVTKHYGLILKTLLTKNTSN